MSYTRSKRKPKRRQGAISRSAGSVTARSKTGAARVRKLEISSSSKVAIMYSRI